MADSGKKVLFVSYDGLSDPLGQSQILPYYKGLQKKGHRICILSCEKKEAFSKQGAQIKRELDALGIVWDYVYYHKSPPVLSTYYDLKQLKKKAKYLHDREGFDIVHCRTILTANIGFKLQKLGAKFIFDFRGFWADERVDGKLWPQANPIYRYLYNQFKKQEKKAFEQADQLISLTENAKLYVKENFSVSTDKIAVVPCSVDLEHFDIKSVDPKDKEQLKNSLYLQKASPIIAYAGSLGTRYLSHEMIDCFAEIQEKYSDAIYFIISNSNTDDLMDYARQIGVAKKICCVSTNYKNIPLYLSLADIALYFIYPGNSGKAVSPTKQAEFLSMGVPIISNEGIGDTSQILIGEKAGIIVDKLNRDAYKSVVKGLDELLEISPEYLNELAKKYFALSKGIETYHQVYQKL